jgi:hypothetical protein
MPLAWIHDLPKQQLEGLASQLGLSTDGTLDDLRNRVKEKWTAVELYLPSQSTAKSFFTYDACSAKYGSLCVSGKLPEQSQN